MNAYVGDDTNDRMLADDSAAQVGDFHRRPYFTDEKAAGASN